MVKEVLCLNTLTTKPGNSILPILYFNEADWLVGCLGFMAYQPVWVI